MRTATTEHAVLGRILHKMTLYLILLNGLLLLGYGWGSNEWPLAKFATISVLLLSYQWLLVRLLQLQARRDNDGYLVYPVVVSGLLLGALLIRGSLIP